MRATLALPDLNGKGLGRTRSSGVGKTALRIFKEVTCWLFIQTGLTWLVARLNRRKGLVLVYHDVYAGRCDPLLNFDRLHVRLERFTRQMRYLARWYRVVSLDQVLEQLAAPQSDKPLAAVTFDDGYRNTYLYAYPMLKKLKLPATIFPITDFVEGRRTPWWDRLRAMLAESQRSTVRFAINGTERPFTIRTTAEKQAVLRELAAELGSAPPERRERLLTTLAATLGVADRELRTWEPLTLGEIIEMTKSGISVGSHGTSHDSFLHLTPDALSRELTDSKRLLEAWTGRSVSWLAYPYGHFSEDTIEAVIRAGYRGALTTIEGRNDGITHPYRLRRIGVDDNMTMAVFIVACSGLRALLKDFLRKTQRENWSRRRGNQPASTQGRVGAGGKNG